MGSGSRGADMGAPAGIRWIPGVLGELGCYLQRLSLYELYKCLQGPLIYIFFVTGTCFLGGVIEHSVHSCVW